VSYRPITDVWILARPKVKYYGAYPNGFLERARALLGVGIYDAVLHVCGGHAKDYPAKPRGFGYTDKTLDLDPATEPDFLQDAREPFPADPDRSAPFGLWKAILADPPYTLDDADKYASGRSALPTPNGLLRNGLEHVRDGGRVGILHYLLPQPPRDGVRFVACVGVIVGYNNRMRVFSVFEKDRSMRATSDVRNQHERGLRGDPVVPRTVDAGTRDKVL
jgi:hypothetical protein